MLHLKSSIALFSASLLVVGCMEPYPIIQTQAIQPPVQETDTVTPQYQTPPPPKKHIELKEVQDDNYSPEYMYPEDKYKKDKPVKTEDASIEKAAAGMSREECISMIGQEKFDKYTQLYGNEEASIKRCTLLKSMQKG